MASTARELYASRFPYAQRNERKKQLHIRYMELSVQGEVFDEYGDAYYRELSFALDSKERTVQLRDEDKTEKAVLTDKEMRKLLNGIVNNYEVFCWEEDYGRSENTEETDCFWDEDEPIDDETFTESGSEGNPSWAADVSYLNGEVQKMCGYDELPDRINELVLDLLALFEETDMDDPEEDDDG